MVAARANDRLPDHPADHGIRFNVIVAAPVSMSGDVFVAVQFPFWARRERFEARKRMGKVANRADDANKKGGGIGPVLRLTTGRWRLTMRG
jgi:hypothetical protein